MPTALAAILAVAAIASGVWDIYVIWWGEPEDTVSAILQSWSVAYPIFPLICGILIGHVFWPQHQKKQRLVNADSSAGVQHAVEGGEVRGYDDCSHPKQLRPHGHAG